MKTRTALPHPDQIHVWGSPLQSKYQDRKPRPDQISFGVISTRAVLSFRSKIPDWGDVVQTNYQGWGAPFKSNSRPALFPKGVITERGYPCRSKTREAGYPLLAENQACSPIQKKYQNGAIPSRSNTRDVLSSKSEILGGW